jgi:protocatechuate 3,4-dioxygenase beta subunit
MTRVPIEETAPMTASLHRFFALLVILALTAFGIAAQDSTTDMTILLQGQLLDTAGQPIAEAVIELWQADINGNYNHPNDATEAELLPDFQYFGTTTTNADGYYAFLTVKPAAYESRPPHLHYKVKLDGVTALTSQWYFEEDRAVTENDGAFNHGGDSLFLVDDGEIEIGKLTARMVTGTIVINTGLTVENPLTVTASQTEGPYYPVVDFSASDNSLNSTAADDDLVTPVLIQPFTLFNLNTMTREQILSIPNTSNRMVREFEEYRPYISIAQFRREIGKYVDSATIAGYETYVYVPVDFNSSDAVTLMQIAGIDDAVAQQLIAQRPFTDQAAFLAALTSIAPDVDLNYAVNFLSME